MGLNEEVLDIKVEVAHPQQITQNKEESIEKILDINTTNPLFIWINVEFKLLIMETSQL